MVRQDDRERDKQDADVMLRSAEIQAKYGTQVDMASIRALMDRDREMGKMGQDQQRQALQMQQQAQQQAAQMQMQERLAQQKQMDQSAIAREQMMINGSGQRGSTGPPA